LIEPATYADILLVASTMRESDLVEIYATRADEDPAGVAGLADTSSHKWIYRQPDGAVVSAFGGLEMWPGVWSVWMFANDLWNADVAVQMIKHWHRTIRVEQPRLGIRRLECRSLATHYDAHRFIEALGLEFESDTPSYGKNGEDFITFARCFSASTLLKV